MATGTFQGGEAAHIAFVFDNVADFESLARAGDQARYRFRNGGWISRIGLNVRF
ncbi:hypothetical protein [Microvirga yunnanensis]|uniref:hypothetical protein n=1 Tax=Microvirga yunnanensis TaxID=2953740 RepID=UPI0021C98B99|nr:hypothetical protein [Microvirga sp. HBU65207]